MAGTVGFSDVLAARDTIVGDVHRTPVFSSRQLSERTGAELSLKAELFQKTGSFKPRGALNRLRRTATDDLERGLVTVSAGNHAQGLAYAARIVGARCVVVMPESAPRTKVDAARGYGAEVVLHGDVPAAYGRMEELRREQGLVLVHPFDDPHVVAGQGTVGLEVVEQLPDVDVIVVPVGGGGLVSGVACAVKSQNPDIRVVGVEPEGAAAMRASWDAGERVSLERTDTVADGLASPFAGEIAFEMTRRYVDEMVVVSDAELVEGMRALFVFAKLYAETAGAAGVAALLAGRIPVAPDEQVCAVLTGGNVDPEKVRTLLGG